jgi:hypothetical protein
MFELIQITYKLGILNISSIIMVLPLLDTDGFVSVWQYWDKTFIPIINIIYKFWIVLKIKSKKMWITLVIKLKFNKTFWVSIFESARKKCRLCPLQDIGRLIGFQDSCSAGNCQGATVVRYPRLWPSLLDIYLYTFFLLGHSMVQT